MTCVESRPCPTCGKALPVDSFRKGDEACVWCMWSSMTKRATYRYRDKRKLAKERLHLTQAEFIAWYEQQADCCAYCGLTFAELKRLTIKRGGGYSVGWDIDRIDSKLG